MASPAYAPPSTIALSAGNDYGATILETLALYRKDPAMAEALKSLDQAVGIFGGPDKAFGWMGDTGVVIARSGESVEGGIVSIPADAAAGAQLLTTLRSFATLGGGQYGITVREEQHAGTTITIIDLGTAKDLRRAWRGQARRHRPSPMTPPPTCRRATSRSPTRRPMASSSSAAAPTSSSTSSMPARASPSPTMRASPACSGGWARPTRASATSTSPPPAA